jgi:hypothetical protein
LAKDRVPEEDQEVDLALTDLPADLRVAPQRSALEQDDVQSELVPQQAAARGGRVQLVTGEKPAVEGRPLQQVLLLVVVGDQRDPLFWQHCASVERSVPESR